MNVENFQGYHREGKLVSPDLVAEKLIKLLNTDDFPQEAVTNVSEI